uniref:Placenta associated 8, tandem duplicate 1 n=1 Tax=Erpetoichthys calabaricus TaxID=27687 RepID=A0A8C4S169_ERPCA
MMLCSSLSAIPFTGCYGICCFPCMACSNAAAMNECCLCGCSFALRGVYRTRYNIKGSLMKDFLCVHFCMLCTVCQLARDIEKRKEQ